MTDYEKAQIRLQAWELIAGWGNGEITDIKSWKTWNWNDRKKYAAELADWAMNVKEDE